MFTPYALVLFVALATTAASDFERGKNAFGRGEYARAIEILRPLLYPEIRLESESQIVQSHRMLGEAHIFEKQNDLAAQEFRKLLQLRPDYRFDPLLDPPLVVDFFNEVLRTEEAELVAMEAKRREATLQRQRVDERNTVEKRFVRNSFAINFIPFGAGQFQNGQRKKGWAFLITESVLGTLSAGALAANFALYGVRPKRPCKVNVDAIGGRCPPGEIDYTDEDRSRFLGRVQIVSGWLFFATVAWGISDAIRNFTPEVPLTLAPTMFGDGTLGTSVAFRF